MLTSGGVVKLIDFGCAKHLVCFILFPLFLFILWLLLIILKFRTIKFFSYLNRIIIRSGSGESLFVKEKPLNNKVHII